MQGIIFCLSMWEYFTTVRSQFKWLKDPIQYHNYRLQVEELTCEGWNYFEFEKVEGIINLKN